MQRVKSCGFLVFRREPSLSFLLMRRSGRFDLPKGHVEEGENELQCAWRELGEETGLTSDHVRIEPAFRFETTYYPRYRRFGGQVVEKKIVLFLGWLESPRDLRLTEHDAFEWRTWGPPHRLQHGTVDEALVLVERFFAGAMPAAVVVK